MSGGAKGAKQPLGRPLDGGVRRRLPGRPSLCGNEHDHGRVCDRTDAKPNKTAVRQDNEQPACVRQKMRLLLEASPQSTGACEATAGRARTGCMAPMQQKLGSNVGDERRAKRREAAFGTSARSTGWATAMRGRVLRAFANVSQTSPVRKVCSSAARD